MTLGELIQKYRLEHGLSQRQFAAVCDLSNGYISMLERGENPKTKLPVTPTLPAMRKIAQEMRITLTDLFVSVDDMPVDLMISDDVKEISAPTGEGGFNNDLDVEIARLIVSLSPEKKREAVNYLRFLSERAES